MIRPGQGILQNAEPGVTREKRLRAVLTPKEVEERMMKKWKTEQLLPELFRQCSLVEIRTLLAESILTFRSWDTLYLYIYILQGV